MFQSLDETVRRTQEPEIIRGETGSVRGVRNMVRRGIAMFLDPPTKRVRMNHAVFSSYIFQMFRVIPL